MNFFLAFLGILIGAASGGLGGALIGGCAGSALGATISLRRKLADQGKQISDLSREVRTLKAWKNEQRGVATGDSAGAADPTEPGGEVREARPESESSAPRTTRQFAQAAFRDESAPKDA